MNTKLFFLASFCLLISNLTQSQNVNIPDWEFKQALLNYNPSIDTDNNNEISLTEAAAVTTLNISNRQSQEDMGGCPDPNDPACVGGGGITSYGISDFTGIEAFTNLTSLTCKNNELTSLNVSALTNLTYLDCSSNQNYGVTIQSFPGIGTLVLPSSGSLETLITNNNNLTSLDLQQQTSLTTLNLGSNRVTMLDALMQTSLVSLVCNSNNMNTLILPNTNSLTTINTSFNKITSLDTSPYTSLVSLVCNNNLINSLLLPNTNTLTTLKCYINQIPSLDIINNVGLTHLDCRNNPLLSLNLTQNTALTVLNCSATQLSSLDLTTNTLLNTVACGGNQISSLDLSRQTNLNTLYCNSNQLTSLNIKNGNNTSIVTSKFNASNNPNLNLICVDNITYANTNFTNKDSQSFYSDLCSFIPTNSNTIKGTVSFDFNNDGCDPSDTKSINTKLTNTAANTSNVTFTNNNGEYLMYTQEATNNIEIFTNLPSFFSVTPTTQSKTFSGSGSTEVIDFCITANQVVNDVKVTVIPTFEARPGFDTSVRVYYENIGSSTLSGNIDLAFLDTQLNFLSENSSIPSTTLGSQTSTLLTWSYTNLLPFEKGFIEVHFNINTPVDPINPVNGGDEITYTSTITCTDTDVDLNNNTSSATEPVVNSYDPNDIICFEGDYIDTVELPNFLNYRIRFQNTGSASAINIVVKNELDADLDWDTFTPISASHNYRPSLTDGNKLEFIFENIHLADSLSNEPESHGWVFFKIKPKSTFSLSDVVESTANIFFDYNAPVITNTARTQRSKIATLTTTDALRINGTSVDLAGNISTNGGAAVTERGIVYSLTSDTADPLIGSSNVIKISNGTGIGSFTNTVTNLTLNTPYSYKSYAINAEGTSYGSVKTFTTATTVLSSNDIFTSKNLRLYPNPVTDILTLKLSNQFKIKKMKIFTIFGKLIMESTTKKIDLSKISNGIYLVKIVTDKGTVSRKIVKH
ncbi:putative secreted protein (Por secretion system target) [Lutibacter sp. Hel_I_33_5]|uniref:DUF7619 domain-containing protein n=1 Tax=Lutibacter sp. Hel_I_33_5 TaxID=1566289 RepID=UPI0011A9FEAE|nr:T9SS type A sorting domain-containing protein [Lutibacter sp. Hel_I_33_5]TVZ54771.1 putative secreted protein (Por secretion system target) [Lutibacter sp. Hel_I_33_5]